MDQLLSKLDMLTGVLTGKQPIDGLHQNGALLKDLRDFMLPSPELREVFALSPEELVVLFSIYELAQETGELIGPVIVAYTLGQRKGRAEPRLR